jgi:hypothetical protein
VPLRLLLALALLSLTACGSAYTSIGYEVSRRSSGTVAPAVTGGDQPSGSVAVGFGGKTASMEIVVHGQDIEMAADPWVAATAGLELKLRPLRVGPVTAFLHGGPERAALFNRDSLEVTWGAGFSYGGGVMVGAHGINLVIDARADEIMYAGAAGSPTSGSCSLKALSIGLQLGH